jgi:hypothetical protein
MRGIGISILIKGDFTSKLEHAAHQSAQTPMCLWSLRPPQAIRKNIDLVANERKYNMLGPGENEYPPEMAIQCLALAEQPPQLAAEFAHRMPITWGDR